MRPTFSTSNDIIQLHPTPNYTSVTPKISSQAFQRGFGLGLGFNSPKNDSQKVITLSTRVSSDIQRSVQRSDRAGVIVDRKNPRPPGDQYIRPPQTSSSVSKTNQYSSDGLSGRIQNNRDSSVPRNKEVPSYQALSSNRQMMPSSVMSSIDFPGSVRREPGNSAKARTLEIDTEQESGRIPLEMKIQSAKNAEIGQYTLNSSGKKIIRSQYTLERPGKLSASTTPTSFQPSALLYTPAAHTEPNEELSPLTGVILKNKTDSAAKIVAGGTFFGGASVNRNPSREKGKSSEREKEKQKVVITGNRKIGFSSNGQLKYTNLSQGLIKANNFFTNSGNSANAAGNKERGPTSQVYKIDYNAMNAMKNQERPGTSEKKIYGRNQDLASAGRIIENKATLEYKRTNSELKRAEQSEAKEPEKDDSPTLKKSPTALQSFVTKVNKGDFTLNLKKSTTDPDSQPNQHPVNKANSDTESSPTRSKNHSPERKDGNKAGRSEENLDAVNPLKLSPSSSQDNEQPEKPSRPITPLIKKEIKDIFEAPAPALDKKAFIYYMTSLEKYHREYDQSNYFCQIYREHFMQSYQAIVFCKYLKPVDQKVLTNKKVTLHKRDTHKDKRTLIFDMDETLIHCNESPSIPSDVVLPIRFPQGEIIEAGINIRPYALECLKELSQYYEIIVFTASHSAYANVVLDYLDPHGLYIHHRLFREHCMPTEEGVYVKDLRVLGNRNLQDVIIVDNASYSFGYQVDNGIPIIPFYDNKTDQELKHLIPYLKFLSTVKDMREINRLTFKMGLYHLYGGMEEVLENLVFQQS